MKRYLGIFILTVMVGLSGCASDTDSDTQVSSRAYSMQIQQNQNRVQTFNGRRQIRSSDGSMWTPPAGSYQDKDGYILDKDGTTIGQTGPLKIPKVPGYRERHHGNTSGRLFRFLIFPFLLLVFLLSYCIFRDF